MQRIIIVIYVFMAVSCIKNQAIDLCPDYETYCGLRGQPYCQPFKLDSTMMFQVTAEDVSGTNLLPDDGQFNARVSGTNTSTTTDKLVDSGATFTTDGLRNQFIVANVTTNEQTFGFIDNDTTISLGEDIFQSTGHTYAILNWFSLAQLGPPTYTNAWWEYVPLYGDNQLQICDQYNLETQVSSPDILTLNKSYRIAFTIRDYVSGTVKGNFGAVIETFGEFSGNGTYEFSGVAHAGTGFGFLFSEGACMTIDNVEVYEICKVGVAISQASGGTPIYVDEDFNDDTASPFPDSPIFYLNQNVQIELNFSDLGLPNGCYFVRVYCTDDPSTYIESRCLTVSDNPVCGLELQWYNDENIGGVVYNYRQFTQTIYLQSEFRNSKYSLQNELYEYSNGDTTILSAKKITGTELRIREVPEYIHNAIASGLILDNFFVDGTQYRFVGEEYAPIWRKNSRNAPAFVELRPKLENYQNNLC